MCRLANPPPLDAVFRPLWAPVHSRNRPKCRPGQQGNASSQDGTRSGAPRYRYSYLPDEGGWNIGGNVMQKATRFTVAGTCFAITLGFAPALALAGPCSSDIAELSRTLSASPTLGGTPTTGALAGAGNGAAPSPGAGGGGNSADRTAGTSGTGRQGGTAGSREMNATVGNQIATSPDDVRRQQEGRPTAAAEVDTRQRAQSDRQRVEVAPGAATSAPDDRAARAKSDLESARALDQRDDGGCRDVINRVRQALQGG